MNIEARLYYHLQQKEEKLERKARELELTQREVQVKEIEQEAIMRIFRERLENTHLLFQTKMENLQSLMALREEGWRQKLDQSDHESRVKDYMHQNEINILNHESRISDWLHQEEVSRLEHTMSMQDMVHQNERLLDDVQHNRELFNLDQVIAQKVHDVHLLEEELQTMTGRLSLKESQISILKEQSVLENKRGQLKDEQLRLSGAEMKMLEQMSRYREEYYQRERSLDRERDELDLKHYRILDEQLDVRERRIEIGDRVMDLHREEQDFDLEQKRKGLLLLEEESSLREERRKLGVEEERLDLRIRKRDLDAQEGFFNKNVDFEQRRWKFYNEYHRRKSEMEDFELRSRTASERLTSLERSISSTSQRLKELQQEKEQANEVNRHILRKLEEKKRELGLS